MIFFIISISFCFVLVYFLLNLIENFNIVEKISSIFLIICAYIILTLEVAGLVNKLNKPLAILTIQITILIISIIIMRLIETYGSKRSILTSISTDLVRLCDFLKKHKLITLFIFIIAVAYGFSLFVSIKFPPNTSDVLYNHLSRVAHWLQQGSLKPYAAFNPIGMTYPYNNSLLMLWSVVFLRTDNLVGFVQFFSAITIAFTIFEVSRLLGFSQKSSLLAGLTFLTFPVVILQASTPQNDLLAAAFTGIAFMFLMKSFIHRSTRMVFFSSLALALALGTKQYIFFILPGYFGLLLVLLLKNKHIIKRIIFKWVVFLATCSLAFGSYAYIQNLFYFDSFFGAQSKTYNPLSGLQEPSKIFEKLSINSSRLFIQFISCEGVSSELENKCLENKSAFFSYLFPGKKAAIESDIYLLDKSENFLIGKRLSLNEESSWFGIMSWVLILPSVLIGTVIFSAKRNFQALFLLLTSMIHFAVTAIIKPGWDPYVGRYLIVSIVLIMPFTAFTFDFFHKHIILRFFKIVFAFICAFTMIFSLLNNDSKPLISKKQLTEVQIWGMTHSVLIQKIAYKLTPLANNWDDVWRLSEFDIKTLGARDHKPPLFLIENFVPGTASITIAAKEGFVMDYLFFGDQLSRIVYPITDLDGVNLQGVSSDFLLISPDFETDQIEGFTLIQSDKEWRLYLHTD